MQPVKLADLGVKVPSRTLILPASGAEIARDDDSWLDSAPDTGALRAAGQLRHVPGRRHGRGRATRPTRGHRGAVRLRGDRRDHVIRRRADRGLPAAGIGWLTTVGFSRPPYAQLRPAGAAAAHAAIAIGAT